MTRERLREAPQPESPAPGWTALATALIERELVGDDTAARAAAEAQVTAADAALRAALDEEGPLSAIAAAADLEPSDIRTLAVCAAVELDRRLQHLVTRLTAAPTGGRLDVDLLARLLGPEAVDALAPDAPLLRAELLEVQPDGPLSAAQALVPRAVVWALLDDQSLDPGLPPGAEVILAPPGAVGSHPLVLVHGDDRTRRMQAALTAGAALAFLTCPVPADSHTWRAVIRQATVLGLGVLLELEGVLEPSARYWIDRAEHLSWALSSRDPLSLDSLPHREFIEIQAPDAEVDNAEWQAVFMDSPQPVRRPTAEQLRLARRVARPGGDPRAAFRRLASAALMRHARRVRPRVGWDDLVLPAAQQRRLHDLVDRYRYRGTVHDEWQLPRYPSPGVVALFSGPSGTGKTTAAEVIAHDLGVDMYRVDLSALVSKYIGETEKNLEEIFSAAYAGEYVLLFDEADALFGSRSAVTDSRDRYANIEVSYLLQRLETYDGFTILTSNLQGNIDSAFRRRIHAFVHFAVPNPEERIRIWDRALGQAPRDDLDLAFVAENFDITGGSIRNAALAAAFFAAARDSAITMVDVLRAISEEFTKLGRRPGDEQFGRWLPELERLQPEAADSVAPRFRR